MGSEDSVQAAARRRRRTSPGDPLPLRLPLPAALPGRVRPEASVPCAAAFDSDAWRFTVDWDGTRTLLFTAPGERVRLQDEALRDITCLYPEVVAGGSCLGERAAVLDGVVTVLDGEGRPDLAALCVRAAVPSLDATRRRPAVYLATDLLHLDGAAVTDWPLDRRHEALRALVPKGSVLQVPEMVLGDGRAFADAATERDLGAVLARRGSALYHCGLASADRLRVALDRRVDTVVIGAVMPPRRRDRVEALLLGEHVDGRLLPAGRVEAGWSAEVTPWLCRQVAALRIEQPAAVMTEPPAERVVWMRPQLTATVRHGGRAADGTLRFAVAVAVRNDQEPAWCIRRAPVPPPEDIPRPPGFRPTVLRTLPM